jgi:hypothetical protein
VAVSTGNDASSQAFTALIAPSTAIIRKPAEQVPNDQPGRAMLAAIHAYFQDRPTDFEKCAVDLWRLIAPATGTVDVTRPSRDGGRDAVGEYVLGPAADPVKIDFALEAKCYAPTTVVGVRDVSRLVSRLRHRNFGVFVTLSHFNNQVYDEVRQDGHPIALVCGRDIVEALRGKGYGDVAALLWTWRRPRAARRWRASDSTTHIQQCSSAIPSTAWAQSAW